MHTIPDRTRKKQIQHCKANLGIQEDAYTKIEPLSQLNPINEFILALKVEEIRFL